ncbi:MAG: methyl-accepting chemotaxis protein [Ilumatobacteraceae bacterium]
MRTFAESATALLSASGALEAITVSTGNAADQTAVQADTVVVAAEQVADHIGSVSASADEMGGSISEIARSASEAATVAHDARRQAGAVDSRVATLAEVSHQIGDVVSLISGIAEQTNLLALNATIEAARAGEAGRGFAVVASEVKDLASATARATGDITAQVETIQRETALAVAGIGEIVTVIEQVSDLQATIAAAVEQQSASTSGIARSVSEAAESSGAITASISAIGRAVNGTSDGVKSSKETIAELAELSAGLSDLIAEFKI